MTYILNILMIANPVFPVDLLCSFTEPASGTNCTRSTSMLVALCRYDTHTIYVVPHVTEHTHGPEPHTDSTCMLHDYDPVHSTTYSMSTKVSDLASGRNPGFNPSVMPESSGHPHMQSEVIAQE